MTLNRPTNHRPQNSIHTQLVGASLPEEIKGEAEVLSKLKELAKVR